MMQSKNSLYRICVPTLNEIRISCKYALALIRETTHLQSISLKMVNISNHQELGQAKQTGDNQDEKDMNVCYFLQQAYLSSVFNAKSLDRLILQIFLGLANFLNVKKQLREDETFY